MKLLFEFLPLILFFIATKFYGPFVAVAVLMGSTALVLGIHWLRHRALEKTHKIVLASVVILGGLTLVFRDLSFVMWKPSIVNWLFSAIVIGSLYIGKTPVIQRMMGGQITLPDSIWRKLSFAWGVFFLAVGLLNVYVAFYYKIDLSENERFQIWTNFKVFWLLGLTLAFTVLQMFYIAKYIDPETLNKENEK